MDFRHQIQPPETLATVQTDALIHVFAADAAAPADSAAAPAADASIDPRLAALIDDAVARGDLARKAGRTLYLHRPQGLRAERLVLACAANASPKAFKSALAAALGIVKGLGAKSVAVSAAVPLGAGHAEAAATAAHAAAYSYRETKPSTPAAPPLARVTLLCPRAEARAVEQGAARGRAVAAGVELACELANLPGNYCTPTYLGQQAKALGKAHGLKVEVLDRKAIDKLGMGSFLAVAQGSDEPPRFIVARYEGAPKSQPPIVLVGKGITFDSGGISIKPAADMDEMKYDMGGAAGVLGTLRAVAELKPALNLVVIVPTCENLPGPRAVKPGDVVTSMSGQTIEVLNTDAEGRLILCDALTYAERFEPACVIDSATLTGACVVALGFQHSGLFSPDDDLAAQLLAAGAASLDSCWRMPLDDEYDEGLKSNFADMANVGPRQGGAITAAMFLKRYTAKYRWAHLDIAGTAWKSGTHKGATGRPVGLLTHFVLGYAK